MIFTLEIKLDNAEVAEAGIDNALPVYLADVMIGVAEGRADAGIVRDGNGNTIGKWRTRDDDESGSLADSPAIRRAMGLVDIDTDSRPLVDDGTDYNGDSVAEIRRLTASGEAIPRGSWQWHEFDHSDHGDPAESCKACSTLRATYGTELWDER